MTAAAAPSLSDLLDELPEELASQAFSHSSWVESRTLGYGLMPLGALLGGLVAEQWGLPAVFLGATVVCLAAVGYPIAVVRQRMVAELQLPFAASPTSPTAGPLTAAV